MDPSSPRTPPPWPTSEGDDVSLAPSVQEQPGRFPPSPPRGEGARRAGEGAEPRPHQTRDPSSPAHARPPGPVDLKLSPGQQETLSLGNLKAGQTYSLLVTLESGWLEPDDRITAELSGAGTDRFVKELHAGDSDILSPLTARARRPRSISTHKKS